MKPSKYNNEILHNSHPIHENFVNFVKWRKYQNERQTNYFRCDVNDDSSPACGYICIGHIVLLGRLLLHCPL